MNDRIVTPFGFASTADEVLAGVDLSGKRAIVTGGASGIGTETARSLAKAGAEVVLAVRRPEAAAEVVADIKRSTANHHVHVRRLDLADPASVRGFTRSWDQPLHILVNNAGIMALPELVLAEHGWEMQFATNFLGHFALTVGMREALLAAGGARVVSVSSNAHLASPVIFDDLHYRFRDYTPGGAYAQSKTANVLLAVEVSRRWSADGIQANSLNPGAIPTNLQKHIGGMKTPVERRKTPQQGAATSVLLAAHPSIGGVGGRYFEDCNQAQLVVERPPRFGGGVAPYALDPVNAERLWDTSMELISRGRF